MIYVLVKTLKLLKLLFKIPLLSRMKSNIRFSEILIILLFLFRLQTTNGVIAGWYKGSSDGELKFTQVTELINNETEGRLKEALITYLNFFLFIHYI